MFRVAIQVGLLPEWFPVEVAFIALALAVVAVLALNKGDWWFINVLAVDEPIIVATGLTMIVASEWLAASVGASRTAWLVIGAALSLLGLYVIRSDEHDIDIIG